MTVRKIKLCDGFEVWEDAKMLFETENWQDVREFFGLDADSEVWNDFTVEMFCFGVVKVIAKNKVADYSSLYTIKAIPCKD